MNTLTQPPEADVPPVEKSTAFRKSPQLSHRGLTAILACMCLVPVVTIFALFRFLPPVYEGQLQASVSAEGLPSPDFYAIEYYQRPPFAGGELIVKNESDQDWTHLNIQVNRHYQIYDFDPIPAGTSKRFQLDRFLSRTGARFSLRYNELKSVRIYARRPTRDRATFFYEFPSSANVQ
jgi:hypothetical protein